MPRNQTATVYAAFAAVESLEARCLMSASPVSLDKHGTLDVNGTRHGDSISVTHDHRHHSLLDVTVDGHTYSFKASAVHGILVNAGAGNDDVTLDSSVTNDATLLGGAGDDTLVAGGGNDVIDGGSGNDHCNFDHHNGIAFTDAPDVVQAGLTTLAQGATIDHVMVFKDDGQTYYGAVVTINNVPTRIVVDANGNPVSLQDNREHNGDHGGDHHGDGDHHQQASCFGLLYSIDTNAGTITVNVASENGPGRQYVFHVDPAAVITADGVATTLDGLHPFALVNLQFAQGDPTTVTSITAFGRTLCGPVTGVDPVNNTITIPQERGGNRTLNVDPAATVTLDGAPSSLSALTNGMHVRLKLSADSMTVLEITALSDNGESHDA